MAQYIGNILEEEEPVSQDVHEVPSVSNKLLFLKKDEFVNMRKASTSAPPIHHLNNMPTTPVAEEEPDDKFRQDPAYYTYYYNQRLLNPRLPPPLMAWHNDNNSIDMEHDKVEEENASVGHSLPQPQPQPKKDWAEIASNNVKQTSNTTAPVTSISTGYGVGVDQIQKDFPRTPSPVYATSQRSAPNTPNNKNGSSQLIQLAQQNKMKGFQPGVTTGHQGQFNTQAVPLNQIHLQDQIQQSPPQARSHQNTARTQRLTPMLFPESFQNSESSLVNQMQGLNIHGNQSRYVSEQVKGGTVPQHMTQQQYMQQNPQMMMQQPYGYYNNPIYPPMFQYGQIPMMMGYHPQNMKDQQRKMYMNTTGVPPSSQMYTSSDQSEDMMYAGAQTSFMQNQMQYQAPAPVMKSMQSQPDSRGRKSKGQVNRQGQQVQAHSQQSPPSQQLLQQDDIQLPKSKIMEEFNRGRGKKFELKDIKGNVKEFSRDQYGSRFLQQKLDNASKADKEMVFSEIYSEALELMTDVYGNYVIQKFFEHGTPSHRKSLAKVLRGHVLALTLQTYGCRVVQKALEVIESEDKEMISEELDGHVMRCVHDHNGNHVIQKCIETVPAEMSQFIVSAFLGNVAQQAIHIYGCRVIQRMLEYCSEKQTKPILDEILTCTPRLVKDQYGNYVVQHVLERGQAKHKSAIIRALKGNLALFSQNKFASNVVEKCYKFGSKKDRQDMLDEILCKGQKDPSVALLGMIKHEYANYVVQKMIDLSDDQQRKQLLDALKPQIPVIKKLPYGKHIISCIEKYEKSTF